MKKKKCKVIMLPTDKAKNCILKDRDGRMRWEKRYFTQEYLNSSPDSITGLLCPKSYHIYITSDDKIEAGDWCINGNGNGLLIKCDQHRTDDEKLTFKKIIATTDLLKLYPETGEYGAPQNEEYVPQIPQSFIEEYCRKGGIDAVDVEYERDTIGGHGMTLDGEFGFIYENPKVNSDNTINIHPIKDSWTRDEVEELLHLALATGSAYGDDMDQENANDWIKHNL